MGNMVLTSFLILCDKRIKRRRASHTLYYRPRTLSLLCDVKCTLQFRSLTRYCSVGEKHNIKEGSSLTPPHRRDLLSCLLLRCVIWSKDEARKGALHAAHNGQAGAEHKHTFGGCTATEGFCCHPTGKHYNIIMSNLVPQHIDAGGSNIANLYWLMKNLVIVLILLILYFNIFLIFFSSIFK